MPRHAPPSSGPARTLPDLLAVHRLGRLLSQGSTLIEKLVGVALESSASRAAIQIAPSLKPADAQAYLASLDKLPPFHPVSEAVDHFERYMALDAILSVRQSGFSQVSELKTLISLISDENARLAIPTLDPAAINWDQSLNQMNAYFDRIVKAHQLPTFSARQKALQEIDEELAALQKLSLAPTTRTPPPPNPLPPKNSPPPNPSPTS